MVYANRSLKGMFFYRGLLGTDHTVFLHFLWFYIEFALSL